MYKEMDITLGTVIVTTLLAVSAGQTLIADVASLASTDPLMSGTFDFGYGNRRFARLCANFRCIQGQCRIVQDCPSCFPQARCVSRDQLPFFADRACQRQNYDAAILTQTSYDYSPLQCSVTVNSCPRGSFCVRGFRGRSRCCYRTGGLQGGGYPGRFPGRGYQFDKPGTCPNMQYGSVGICGGRTCLTDNSCPGYQKCCPSSCGGNTCTSPSTFHFQQNRGGCGICPAGTYCRQGRRFTSRCVPLDPVMYR